MDDSLPRLRSPRFWRDKIAALDPARLPAAVRRKCEDLLVDVVGLCLTARNEDYVKAALAGWDDEGPCTAIGHARTMSAAGAAFVNGTAAHGEDFDDTFEGGPGACRRGDRAGGARGLRAAQSRRAARRCSASRSASR